MLVFIVFILIPACMIGASSFTYYLCRLKRWEITELARNEAVSLILRQYNNNKSDACIDDKYLEKRVLEIKIDAFGSRLELEMMRHSKDNILLFRPKQETKKAH